MKTIGIISLACIVIGAFAAITGLATLRVEYTEPTAIDSRREGSWYETEPNAADILRDRDPNGFWLGNVYLSHDFKIISGEI